MDIVLEEAAGILGINEEELFTKGYRIYTSLDKNLQEYSEELYAKMKCSQSPPTGIPAKAHW